MQVAAPDSPRGIDVRPDALEPFATAVRASHVDFVAAESAIRQLIQPAGPADNPDIRGSSRLVGRKDSLARQQSKPWRVPYRRLGPLRVADRSAQHLEAA